MKTTPIREGIYEFIKLYVDTPEPKKLCSSIEDLVEELAESKVKNFALPVVGWRSEQLPEFDIDDINEIIEECKENKDSLETLISRIWNRGLITGVNSEAEINSK